MAYTTGIITAALLLTTVVCNTHPHPSESAVGDQYEQRGDESHPLLLPSEATDHPLQLEKLHRPPFVKEPIDSTKGKRLTSSEIKVSKGDGLEKDSKKTRTRLRRATSRITKRSFYPWDSNVNIIQPQYQSIAVWKPPVYQLSRPYYVPIYGAPGRIPIYFPPQPVYLNPGLPPNNPVRPPYQGPTYLPPVTPPTEAPPEETTMMIVDRFNNGDDDDDRPIWDMVTPGPNQQRPAQQPTRRPGPEPTSPPLVHDKSDGGNASPPPQNVPFAPPAQMSTPAPPPGPSRCVWAIINCCSATSEIRYNCFEAQGCTGAFWDASPCDSEFADAAIEAAFKYYDK